MSSESEDREPVDVFDIIAYSLDTFSSLAWQKLGLQPDMIAGGVEVNLEQARIAIDVAAKLAEFIEPKLDEEDKRRVQSMLSDLRISYLRQTQKHAEED
jgi:hypothetical protein